MGSDWLEQTVQNENEDAGIVDWNKFEAVDKYGIGKTAEQKQADYAKLIEDGTIADVDKFNKWQADQQLKAEEQTPEEKSL